MAIAEVKAIDYNILKSLIVFVGQNIQPHLDDYGLNGLTIDVIPSYPANLADYHKPSIIIQKISSDTDELGFGGFVGQHLDEAQNSLSDVFGYKHIFTIQIDTASNNNTQCSTLSSLVLEKLLLKTKYSGNIIDIYDHTSSETIKPKMCDAKIHGPINTSYFDNQYLSMTDRDYINHDYTSALRFDLLVTQLICPEQEYIDLSKGFDIRYTITGGN